MKRTAKATNSTKATTSEGANKVQPHRLLTVSLIQNAAALKPWSVHGEPDTAGLLDELAAAMRQVTRNDDMKGAEAMLYGQAMVLQVIFTNLSRRAALNAGEYMSAAETYLRLALKAQSQCRATLETLNELKNPRPVAFVRQANIAHGPQQVNNGAAPGSARQGAQTTVDANVPSAGVLPPSSGAGAPTVDDRLRQGLHDADMAGAVLVKE